MSNALRFGLLFLAIGSLALMTSCGTTEVAKEAPVVTESPAEKPAEPAKAAEAEKPATPEAPAEKPAEAEAPATTEAAAEKPAEPEAEASPAPAEPPLPPSLSVLAAPTVKDLTYFLGWLVDLDRLAILEDGVQTKQFSSYDRASRYDEAAGKYVDWDANGDAGQYLRVEPSGEAVMAEMEGPGCVWRIWSANPQGKIRFYFDGAASPSCEFDFGALFSGTTVPFIQPLVWQRRVVLGGTNPASDCYLPIPFARSLKVTADKAHNQYYHFGYSTFPEDWKVKTFAAQLTAEEQTALDAVAKLLQNAGVDPQPATNIETIDRTVTLEPGEPVVLTEITGPATIRQFCAKVESPERWARRTVLLQMYWDGGERPAVEAPLGDFFGDAWDESTYRSLPLGITEELNYCYFRMPFNEAAGIVATNRGTKAATLHVKVVYQPGPLPPQAAHFHAKWRRDRESKDFDYPILECAGKGRFVGVALFTHNIVGGWWGEGDEKAHVDGEKFPSTFGTGSEDYFGDAWGIRYFVNPFHGCPTREEARRQSCYRWHVSDGIPFATSFGFTIENYAALRTEPGRNDYSSVAYWYQAPGGSDFFESPSPEALMPQGRVVLGALEAEAAVDQAALPAGAKIVTDDDMAEEMSGGAALKLSGTAGTSFAVTLAAPEENKFTVEAVPFAAARASKCAILKDGQPVGDKVRLAAGKNTFEVKLAGDPVEGDRCEAVIDYFLLHPYRNFVRRWYLAGPFDNASGTALEKPFGPEEGPFKADQTFEGLKGQVAWKTIEVPSGVIASEAQLLPINEDIVAYAYCEIQSPEARKATAFAGSDDGVKVWVNGAVVHTSSQRRALVPDQDRFDIDLKEGRNTILIKIDQGGGPWGFAFRINDPDEKLSVVVPE